MIVGAAQLNDRSEDVEPIEFMTRVSSEALADTESEIADHIQSVRVIKGLWRYRDPGTLVGSQLGIADAHSGLTRIGGNGVYDLINETAGEIQSGQLQAVLICSAEVLRTIRAKKRSGHELPRIPEADSAGPGSIYGKDRSITSPKEEAAGLNLAVNFYAAAETALRHRLGEGAEQHLERISELWARASRVAATNPSAWIADEYDPATLTSVGPKNRMVSSPYPKLLTANINVDQAAAIVMCSADAAEATGVPRDKWVFPWSGSGAADHWSLSKRYEFDGSPAMRMCGETALKLAGLTLPKVDMLDLYSCFPIAVQLAQRELGVPSERPYTITGGLTFAGGPLNTYCMHALARSVELLRESENSTAMLTGNGGFFTKHSCTILGASPSGHDFAAESPQHQVDLGPARPAPGRAERGTVETYTVTYGPHGADRAIVTVLDDTGARHLTNSRDTGLIAAMLANDMCETPARIDHSTAVPTVHV